jgi:hypothetical protein
MLTSAATEVTVPNIMPIASSPRRILFIFLSFFAKPGRGRCLPRESATGCNSLPATNFFTARLACLQDPPPLNDADQHHDYGDYKQNMDQTAHGIRSHQA